MAANTVNVKGSVVSNDEQWVYDLFAIEATSPKKIEEEINNAKGNELEVIINSGGGNVFAASEIYTNLKSYKNNVIVKIVGIAASAASVIAMSGKKILMSPTSQMMIHNVSTCAQGDYRDMEHSAAVLRNANKTIAAAYQLRTGLSEDVLLKLMDNESWFTPEQALKYNFIDGILFAEDNRKSIAQAKLDLLKVKKPL